MSFHIQSNLTCPSVKRYVRVIIDPHDLWLFMIFSWCYFFRPWVGLLIFRFSLLLMNEISLRCLDIVIEIFYSLSNKFSF